MHPVYKFTLFMIICHEIVPEVGAIPMTVVGTLPSPRSGTVVLYNGDYKFYVIGGAQNGVQLNRTNEVVIYDKSYNTHELLTRLPPPTRLENIERGFGFVQKSDSQNITLHYIGGDIQYMNGDSSSRDIWTLNSNLNELSVQQTFEFDYGHRLSRGAAFWDSDLNMAYIVDSSGWKYFPQNSTVVELGKTNLRETQASVYVGNEIVYIFGGGTAGNYDNMIRRYDLKTGNITVLETRLLYHIFRAEAVWNEDEKVAYIVGGLTNDTSIPITGIQQFDPETEQVTLLDIQLPHTLSQFSLTWIKYFNELYIFGGLIQNGPKTADVMMVKLNDLKTRKFKR